MKSEKKSKKEKRSSSKSGKKRKKSRNGKPKAELRFHWKAPKKPLGEMIEGRFFVLKRLYRHRIWLCFDLQESRDVVVKTKRHKRSKKSKNVKGRTALHMQGELEQKQPLAEGRTALPMLFDELKKEINDTYADLLPPLSVKVEEYQQLCPATSLEEKYIKEKIISSSLTIGKMNKQIIETEKYIKEEIISSPLIIVEVVDQQISHAPSPIKEKPVEDERKASPMLKEKQQVTQSTAPIAEELVEDKSSEALLLIENIQDISHTTANLVMKEVEEEQDVFHAPFPMKKKPRKDERSASLLLAGKESQQVWRTTSPTVEKLVEGTASPLLASELNNQLREICHSTANLVMKEVEEKQDVFHAPFPMKKKPRKYEKSASRLLAGKESQQVWRTTSPTVEKLVEGTASSLLASELNNQLREIYVNLRTLPIGQDVEKQQMICATSSIEENLVQETPCASPLLSVELNNEISEIMTNISPYLIEEVKENQQVCRSPTPMKEIDDDQDESSASSLLIDKVNNQISVTYPHLMPEHVCHVRSTEEEKLEQIEASSFLAEVKDILENKTRKITNEKKKVDYPVKLGDLLDDRYYVEEMFWISSRCAVWLCWDLSAKQQVVLKMSTSKVFESLDFRDELDMLEMVHSEKPEDPRKERIIKVLGDFQFMPPNQRRFCIVLESMYCDLSHLLEAKGKLPLGLIRPITKQILEGLEYLHSCDIIHTDIKPANIVLSWEKDMQSLSVKIIDFGNACLTDDKAADVIQTPPYRSPEVWLKINYDTPADIWSTACLIFELASNRLLFTSADHKGYSRCEDHLAAIMELLGPIPREILSQCELEKEYFDEDGRLIKLPELNELSFEDTLMQTCEYLPQQAKELAEFLQPMLELEPSKRATATECLQHPWLNGNTNANELRQGNVGQEEMEQDN